MSRELREPECRITNTIASLHTLTCNEVTQFLSNNDTNAITTLNAHYLQLMAQNRVLPSARHLMQRLPPQKPFPRKTIKLLTPLIKENGANQSPETGHFAHIEWCEAIVECARYDQALQNPGIELQRLGTLLNVDMWRVARLASQRKYLQSANQNPDKLQQ